MSGKAGFRRAGGLEIPEVLEGEGIGRGYFLSATILGRFWKVGLERAKKPPACETSPHLALDEVTQMENFSLNFTGPTG